MITGLSTGGAERALYNVLAEGLAQRFESAVISLLDEGTIGGPIRELGVPVYGLHIRRGLPTPGAVGRLWRRLRAFRPDIIQGWMYHGNLVASVAVCLAPGRPALAWNIRHSLYDLKAEKPLTRQVIRANRLLSGAVDAIIYNSHLSCSQHESFGFQNSRAVVIPNGFDLQRLRPDLATGMAVRQELGLPRDATVIGHVARFHPMKDHVSFLRAAVQVARQYPSTRFLLVGRDVSPDNATLAGIVPPELLERFVFTGQRSDPHRLMQAMDVFCSSSNSESSPNVLGEAMACGVPCVTTDVGDSAAIVGDTGFVVPPADWRALASKMERMVCMNPEQRRVMGRAARERIQSHYGLSSVVAQYADFYRKLRERRMR